MDSPKKAEDHTNNVAIVTIGICGALLVWVSIIALQAYYEGDMGPETERKAVAGQDVERRTLAAAQQAELTGFGWLGTDHKTVRMPIEIAKERVLRDAKAGKQDQLVPASGSSTKSTAPAAYGKQLDLPPPVPGGAASVDGLAPVDGAAPGDGAAAAPGAPAPAAAAPAAAAPAPPEGNATP